MKQLVCEMCGSSDLLKEDGVFVCQTCGCKYSVEEARKMMVEGTVEVKGTVKIDNTDQIQNFLNLSKSAYDSGNGNSALDYANKALEIDPQNSEAWIAKMKSIEYIGTLGKLQLTEVIESGKNAIAYADKEKKENIMITVYKYQLIRSLDLLKLAMNKMNDTDNIRETYKSFCRISIWSAAQNTLKADNGAVNLYDNIANEAISMVLLVPDDILGRHLELANIVSKCAKQYQFETEALEKRYKIYGASLTSTAKSTRNSNKNKMTDKAENAKQRAVEYERKKAKEEKLEKTKAYWAEHKEEKEKLEKELSEIEEKLSALQKEKDNIQIEINDKLDAIRKERDRRGTSEEQRDACKIKIDGLQKELKALGMFKGKEKKAIQEKIDAENRNLQIIEERVSAEKKEKEKIAFEKMNEVKNNSELDTLTEKISGLSIRKIEIIKELNKDR